ncbi:glucan endo-1,3-beta-glucosidase 7-like [Arabidopsis lyrata subsp. lyrata]|uniref:glucan endo-1,3-beta-glucosidase 7-like n=1 Tax=Arabidopsis lyrata subsp. lyrata TaxID=81972 RepID=UPI000A29E723|nr:glucan endo-1,3-beta-glucosidase 7-like [Arabidopsis lyrata subsp. lyrata]|eukprot:XP_020870233.1 glucan endo-1,3-beta-glucosidase 7-like [Arabidopsis lyrata subsp. lyrata]
MVTACVKIFDVNPDILRAFAGTGISVVVTVPNGDIPALTNGRQARRWVSANILPFHPQTKIKYISVGNEILLTGDNNMINNLLPAMRNLNNALVRAGVRDVKIKFEISTLNLRDLGVSRFGEISGLMGQLIGLVSG